MKIGRNDPCPCGSGKKYKKCCLRKDEEAIWLSRQPVTEKLPEPVYIDDFIVQKLQELIDHGPFHAERAVTINKKIPLEELENTPIIRSLQVFLETIAIMGGKAPINEDGHIEIDQEILLQTAKRWPGYQFPPVSQTGISLHELSLAHTSFLCLDLGFLQIDYDEHVFLTDKGKALLNNTGIRKTYNRAFKQLTEKNNWFLLKGFPDAVLEIQDLCGFMLFLLKPGKSPHEPIRADNMRKQMDSTISLSESLSPYNISTENLSFILNDYFLGTYCRLLGFVVPDEENWSATALFSRMFSWHV